MKEIRCIPFGFVSTRVPFTNGEGNAKSVGLHVGGSNPAVSVDLFFAWKVRKILQSNHSQGDRGPPIYRHA